MTDDPAPQAINEDPACRARTVLLLAVGAIAAWLVWWITDMSASYSDRELNPSVLAQRSALATGIAVAAIAFGFGLERIRVRWTAGFALVLGLIAGLILWWNNDGHGIWSWSGASLFLAIVIAVPLFQVARDAGRLSFPYSRIHGHAWTNVVLWFACWAFAGISMLLTVLMAELFKLIGITFLHGLLEKGWFPALVIGGAFGAALGMFRDMDHVVRLLQRVVMSALAVLAPVLGVGLLIFLLSMPFTGLQPLWDATKSTTPILITCVIGALILANAVIGHGPDDEAKNPVLRWGAMALGVSMLPLAVVAAIATGLRIHQYGFTPDRLWALIFVILASVYGVVYFAALLRKRQDWAIQVRPDNIRLAFATIALALLLATPLVGFNSISANSQVARLKSGKVGVDKFDWAALAFDFGDPGRRALGELQRSANGTIAKRADEVAKASDRMDILAREWSHRQTAELVQKLRVLPVSVSLPEGLRGKLVESGECGGDNPMCVVLYKAGATEAWALQAGCFLTPSPSKPTKLGNGEVVVPMDVFSGCAPHRFTLTGGKWGEPATNPTKPADKTTAPARKASLDAGKIEVRTVPRRQLFIGDEPVGDSFE